MYTYEHYNLRVFTFLLGMMVFIFLVYAEYIGATISLVLGVFLSFSYTGVKIDMVNKRYVKYDRFTKLRIGQWKALPNPSYVTLVRIKLSNVRNMASPMVTPEPGKRSKSYKVNLVVEGDKRFIAICRGPKEKMTQEALKLGKKLDVRVLDYTSREKKWIL